jgi:dTDP-4-amino-4,6-dideoxygalactose transaminase
MDKPVVLGGRRISSESIKNCSPLIPNDILSSGLQNDINNILKSGMLSNFAKYTKELESQLRDILAVEHVLTVSNGTTGLEILLSTLPKESEVLVPSYTFPSTVHAITCANLKPKFVDIDKATGNISLQDVKLKINKKTTKAILAVNAFGNPCEIEALEDITKHYQIKLFFDSAAAIGSRYRGRPLGSRGHAEVFSLSGTKVVTAGEGGIITTKDGDLARELDCKRNYGYDKLEKDCLYIGFNGKLSEMNAIIALWSLRDMERNIAWRRKTAAIYRNHLSKIRGIHCQKITDGGETNFCAFAIEIDPQDFGLNASEVQECLKEEGIETLRYFCPPMHKTRAYKEFNHLRLEQSEILSQRNLCLPMHVHLTVEQAQTVCRVFERIHVYAGEIRQKCLELSRQETGKQNRINFGSFKRQMQRHCSLSPQSL